MIERKGAWIQTYTGRKFWPLDPRADEVDIVDIAHALSMVCRFQGHCNRFYSVAEHSLRVAMIVDERLALPALLHDAAEAYISDLSRPVKRFMPDYREYEQLILDEIWARFGLFVSTGALRALSRADNIMLGIERVVLFDNPLPWPGVTEYSRSDYSLECLSPGDVEVRFLDIFGSLDAARTSKAKGGPTR